MKLGLKSVDVQRDVPFTLPHWFYWLFSGLTVSRDPLNKSFSFCLSLLLNLEIHQWEDAGRSGLAQNALPGFVVCLPLSDRTLANIIKK